MPAYYHKALAGFVTEDASSILWKLAQANAAERFPLTPEAIEAWGSQLPVLVGGVTHILHVFPESQSWSILLEYPIPVVGRRIDVVLLARNIIIVIETKTGTSLTSATRQVDDYALNLACFHEKSAHKIIVPLVVADAPVTKRVVSTEFDTLIEHCRYTSTSELGSTLETICRQHVNEEEPQIDAELWNQGRFSPIPPIIEAAVALYSDMDVFEIGHACAARKDLDNTTDVLVKAVLDARREKRKAICFATGVPGAGKTLVGLNTVHRPEIKDFSSFLSGNGPLVKVIQEALVRDVVKRSRAHVRVSRRQAQLEVRAFVHNVHRFADHYYGENQQKPVQRVIVFDEAQRAWDAEENARAGRAKTSEPNMMIEVMDRHDDWAVIVALIGSGQEINRGEAGLAEWGRALARFPRWRVYAPPNMLGTLQGDESYSLFNGIVDRHQERIIESPALHLKVCTRSIRAQRISEWVDAMLSGNPSEAMRIAEGFDARPVITRSLATARAWLNSNRRGKTRSGLVASASAVRLRADGLEPTFDFQQRFDWEHWFLDIDGCSDTSCKHEYCNDVRASSRLEVAATQFKIQGLELDWIGLCWGEDLTWNGYKWTYRRFNNKQWRTIKDKDKRRLMYLVNSYRVLMTRARQGMIVYVPRPADDDPSRLPLELNLTAEFLVSCGAMPIDK